MTVKHPRFEFGEALGSGGFGVVYRARDIDLNREVAVKVFNPWDLQFASIAKEAKSLSKIDHPGIVKVFGLEKTDDGEILVIMELFDGENAATIVRRDGRLSSTEVIQIAKQVCSALAHCHERGILHRDIKPENLVLQRTPDGQWTSKLIDFGLAKVLDVSPEQTETASGAMKGSVHQMSPEVCNGGKVTARSEIYSLGCTLFELVTGRTVFEGYSPVQVIVQHATQHPPKFSELLPEGTRNEQLERCIYTCLEKSPEDRFSSATQMLLALSCQDYTQCLPKQKLAVKRSNQRIVTVVTLLTLLGAALLILQKRTERASCLKVGNDSAASGKTAQLSDALIAKAIRAKSWLDAGRGLDTIARDSRALTAFEISQCKQVIEHCNGSPKQDDAALLADLALRCALCREQNAIERDYWLAKALHFAEKSGVGTRLHVGTYATTVYARRASARKLFLRAISIADSGFSEVTESSTMVVPPDLFKAYCEILSWLPDEGFQVDKELRHTESYINLCLSSSSKATLAQKNWWHSLRGTVRLGLKDYCGAENDLAASLKGMSHEDKLSRANVMILISCVTSRSGNFARALNYARNAYEICAKEGKVDPIIVSSLRLAQSLADSQQYETAEIFFKKATQLSRERFLQTRGTNQAREEIDFEACNSLCLKYLTYLRKSNRSEEFKHELRLQEALWRQVPESLQSLRSVDSIRKLSRQSP